MRKLEKQSNGAKGVGKGFLINAVGKIGNFTKLVKLKSNLKNATHSATNNTRKGVQLKRM